MKFKPKNRIRQASIYQEVFADGGRFSTVNFLAFFKKNTLDYSRLGLAIRKKHLKKATQRNTMKRLCRENFRLHLLTLPSWDIVITSRQTSNPDENKLQIRTELNTLWQKLAAHIF